MTKHEIKVWELVPPILIHTIRTFEDYKKEIHLLEQHIDHLGDRHNGQYDEEMTRIVASKELLKKSNAVAEIKLWTKEKLHVGDFIHGKQLKLDYKITTIVEQRDHSGVFENPEDSKMSFYILHVVGGNMS